MRILVADDHDIIRRGLKQLFGLVAQAVGRVRFELRLQEIAPGEEIARDGYRVAACAVSHRSAGIGYVLFEDERPGVFDPEHAWGSSRARNSDGCSRARRSGA